MTEPQDQPQAPGGELVPYTGAADTHYEIALDDVQAAAEVVHPPGGFGLPAEPGQLRPVVPEHLRTLRGVEKAIFSTCTRAAHRGAYHGIRAPGYLLKAAGWAVVGLVLTAGRVIRWWWLAEQTRLRSLAVISGDSREWRNLHKDAKNSRRDRGLVLLAAAFGICLAMALMWKFAPWWGWAVLAAVLLPLLARAGRPADRRIIRPASTTPRFRVINADVVLRAYYAAGLGHPDKPGQQITFGAPMSRDGDGSRVLVDLPFGKGLEDAVKARPAIASGLDVTLSQTFIHRDPTSHRRHVLWVADRDPLAVPVGRTPLLACRSTDIWKPAPMGLDERGQLVTVPLMWHSVLVSALPRAGKTFSARLLALYAALDPYVKLSVFDFKGSPDWRKFALVADRCAFGLTPTREGLPLQIFGDVLTEIKADVQDRYERLSAMDPAVCPEGKLTREIARSPRYKMPVRLLILEEFQEAYEVGKDSLEAAKLLTYLVKVAPGAGVILLGSTQRPSGVGGGGELGQQFTSFRDN
jgi:hypothetical protein